MTHRVYYLPTKDHNFCHDTIDFSSAYPRSSTSTNTSLTWVPPFILMVDRSSPTAENCNFVQMVRTVLFFVYQHGPHLEHGLGFSLFFSSLGKMRATAADPFWLVSRTKKNSARCLCFCFVAVVGFFRISGHDDLHVPFSSRTTRAPFLISYNQGSIVQKLCLSLNHNYFLSLSLSLSLSDCFIFVNLHMTYRPVADKMLSAPPRLSF
jgi:hypothetical protein